MFCDLVGSTNLAAKLDAEDWRNLVNAYLDQASAAVTDFGGHVLKKLGDGLMALFGYPKAQENDAERAVRAALAIQRALADLNARSVAVLDNLPAHISAAVEKAIRARGAWLLFLLPYSPDLNPIEMAFAKLKALLRARALRTIDALWRAIGEICDRLPGVPNLLRCCRIWFHLNVRCSRCEPERIGCLIVRTCSLV
jgi:transposase